MPESPIRQFSLARFMTDAERDLQQALHGNMPVREFGPAPNGEDFEHLGVRYKKCPIPGSQPQYWVFNELYCRSDRRVQQFIECMVHVCQHDDGFVADVLNNPTLTTQHSENYFKNSALVMMAKQISAEKDFGVMVEEMWEQKKICRVEIY